MIRNRVIIQKFEVDKHHPPSTPSSFGQSKISSGHEKDKPVGNKKTFQNGRNTDAEGSYSKERLFTIVIWACPLVLWMLKGFQSDYEKVCESNQRDLEYKGNYLFRLFHSSSPGL
jgi:hypothetical protein